MSRAVLLLLNVCCVALLYALFFLEQCLNHDLSDFTDYIDDVLKSSKVIL